MPRKVYVTKLKPEFREQYIEAHRNVSGELLRRYARAGMTHCSVYLHCDTLVMVVDAEDHAALAVAMESDELDATWQSRVRPMKADGDWQEADPLFAAEL